MAATATGILINFSPVPARRCSNLRCNISPGVSIIFPASGSSCRYLRIQASKSEVNEPDIIFQGYIDDAKYLAKLGAGSVLGAAAIKYGSALFPQLTTPNISQALLMISSPVVIAVLLLINKSGVEKKETETKTGVEKEEVTITGIEKEVVSAGTGPKPVRGQNVTVHCTGFGKNGDLSSKFWSTKDPGEKPFTFRIGQGSVIKGWDEGVLGMQVGEVARLKCSPDYAYGSSGFQAWGIQPNSTLIFEIEVLKIE